jgi:SAM-dependent methyltransferase
MVQGEVTRRLVRLKKYVQAPNGKKILDIGCALGHFLKECEKEGFDTFGIDISKYAIERAKVLASKSKFYNLDVECEDLPFPSRSFDVVTAFDLLEHLKVPRKLMYEVNRVLVEKGIFYMTTPNPYGIGRILLSKLSAKWKDRDPTHVNIRPVGYWVSLLSCYGFRPVEISFLIENLFGKLDFIFPKFGGTIVIISVKAKEIA